jgi:hypothetical protein
MTSCVLLAYGEPALCRQSLDSFLACGERLEIDVLENPHPQTGAGLRDHARTLLAQGHIRSYVQFEQNISNNAMSLHLASLKGSGDDEFIVLSDGDVLVPSGTIAEQRAIFANHPEVFACGLRVDASKWPDGLSVKAQLYERMNTPKHETGDYVNSATGLWCTLFRAAELRAALEFLDANRRRLTDGHLKFFGQHILRKRWVATKDSLGRELSREATDYGARKKVAQDQLAAHGPEPLSSYGIWNHAKVARYTVHSRDTARIVDPAPLPPSVPRHREALATDVVIAAIANGELGFETGYLVGRVPTPASPPGLYAVWQERGVVSTGYPRYTDDKAVVFLGRALLEQDLRDAASLPRVLKKLVVQDAAAGKVCLPLVSKMLRADGEIAT